jgi:sugar phosphate isomerase/epimerase
MRNGRRPASRLTRRQFTRAALVGPAAAALGLSAAPALVSAGRIDPRINGVQIGAITYSFRAIPDAEVIVQTMAKMGIGLVELMSNHAEALAGAPPARDADALRNWRGKTSADTWRAVRTRFDDAGITLRLLCYNMNVKTFSDADIEYGFRMAQGLGVNLMSTSTQVSMARRVAPFADRYRITVAYHGHANLSDPDEVASPESFAACLAASRFHAINLDIGHFTAAGFDAVAFLRQHHDHITHLHLKDRRSPANGGANVPWGQGDTPIKEVLQLLKRERWDIPANVEFEYPGDPLVEVPRCLKYCRNALSSG